MTDPTPIPFATLCRRVLAGVRAEAERDPGGDECAAGTEDDGERVDGHATGAGV